MSTRSQTSARGGGTARRSRIACALTALSLAVSGALTATPAAAVERAPAPAATEPAATGTVPDPAAGDPGTPTPAGEPEPSGEAPKEPAEMGEPGAPAETAVPDPSPAVPEGNAGGADADVEAEVEVPVEELSQEQLRQLLAVLQGKHGAEMGSGLEQRRERIEELTEPEAQEELDEQLEVLEIERSASLTPAAAPLPVLSARDDWSPDGIQGIDVSSHQPSVTWKTEWDYGARFAYVKSTEALNYKNPYWETQYTGSYRQGMIRGSYHFAIPNVSSGQAQATYFVRNGGGWSADGKTLPPLLDIEYNPYPELGNTCYNMSPAQMVAWIRDFSNTIRSLTGRLPAIYTTAHWWNQCTGNSTVFRDHPLHIAHYPYPGYTLARPTLPAGWASWDIWQYSSTGPFTGDSNVWRGSQQDLQNFAYNRSSAASQVTSTRQDYAAAGDLTGDRRGDLLSRRTDGSLWLYPGNGAGGYGSPRKLGEGWQIYNAVAGGGDLNGDSRPDLLARQTDGSLWFYAGTGSGTYHARVRNGASGWNQYADLLGTGDLNGDGRGDLLAKRTDGTVYFYPGLGSGKVGSRVLVASGWQGYRQLVAPRDFTGDGKADVVARGADGTLWLLPGTGKAAGNGTLFGRAQKIGSSGWEKFTTLLGVGDNNGDGRNDLLAISADQSLRFYAGTQMQDSSGMKPRVQTGTDIWDSYSEIITPGDFNGDGRADLIGRKPNGQLWFAAGNGQGGYGPRVRIGHGWQIYSLVFGVGDYNRDGRNDLLARQKDGSLWFYAGTGKVGGGNEGYQRRVKIGTSGWNQYSRVLGAGDVNRDGRADLLAVRPDGTVWLYAGPGNGRHGTPTRIASGWQQYSYLTAAGDYTGDGAGDIIARKPDGTLWLLAGRRTYSAGWFAAERKIGSSGWNAYDRIAGPGDFTSDRKVDLLATAPAGYIWRYNGTQFVIGALSPRKDVGRL
ncbi:GH25 family lysozyme [Arthrobacter mobilis]|uniref:lysozyme n=1 Tax=Arthrobacter mobilis TaxID=2724944 RepID=A0A7X6K7C3_9MICC|nr:GH25 family lysozyme [Arthrobacter mobilis]NKX56498.1 lysozyme M1 [Arthrobacter mobilis]